MDRLIIKGGRVIDPANGVDSTGDVVIEAGAFASVGGSADVGKGDRVFDASGCIVCPGLIDPHVHAREPGGEEAETIATCAAAAVEGGFTSVCCMPNTEPALDHAASVKFVYRQSKEARRARVFPVGAVTKGREGSELAEVGLMSEAGAVGFSDDGTVVASAGVMVKALKYLAMVDRALMQHCQEPTLTSNSVMNSGPMAVRLGLMGWPAVAEEVIIERDIRLNRRIGCSYHVQHVSCAGSVELVRAARADGQPVTAEASPHHLLLTEDMCDGYNTMAKVNPPLRRQADVDAIRAGVADGTITILATDHAPHAKELKALEFDAAPFGMVGLETALGLYVKALVEPGLIDWPKLIEMMTINPARLCRLEGLPHQLGTLTVGRQADVTVIDPAESWQIDESVFAGKSSNTPFMGWDVTGRAVGTFVGGRTKLDRHGRGGE
ncbi:MAG: dihydroorotase [Planctomycetes bacterium]|nr:dihydroorotase [Planctomycetota bacterium]NOG52907.1 dihydroorotase [Planctomycetota bacterium]